MGTKSNPKPYQTDILRFEIESEIKFSGSQSKKSFFEFQFRLQKPKKGFSVFDFGFENSKNRLLGLNIGYHAKISG